MLRAGRSAPQLDPACTKSYESHELLQTGKRRARGARPDGACPGCADLCQSESNSQRLPTKNPSFITAPLQPGQHHESGKRQLSCLPTLLHSSTNTWNHLISGFGVRVPAGARLRPRSGCVLTWGVLIFIASAGSWFSRTPWPPIGHLFPEKSPAARNQAACAYPLMA
jgi:hypothetical protein